MDIEIVGRHALLFDDDATAAFVNSQDALVEWNSLLIDRYDVRHLLSSPPPSRRRRNLQPSHSSSADAELDYERYLDLPSPSDEQEDAKPEAVGGFNAVPFSYGNNVDSNDQKNAETESECPGFYPPFPVPDSLIQHLPSTEKVHQIIARTALFVSKNGGQSEIVLRVKQGDNPTFGFLMPDHHLHAYFRFLVDHQDLLQSKDDKQTENEEKISNPENAAGAGALSLLGSVYGTGEGEDEDGGAEHASPSRECVSGSTMDVDATSSLALGKTLLPAVKDESVSKHSLPSKEDVPISKRSSISNALKAGRTSSTKKGESSGSLSAAPDKLRASSLPPIPESGHMLLDPPSDMKRLVDKIVEFIIKNGRQFEAVLMEQDRDHGRFPFLIPANKFHPYYLKVLQKAQESKLTVKSFHNEKEDFKGHALKKKMSISRESENCLVESDDIPLDSERKEKFKMVINKSKREGSDLPSKSTQQQLGVQVDAAQAAAILQAATRGIKLPDFGILSKTSLNGKGYGPCSEGGHSSNSSQPNNAPKAIARTAAKEVANEADSSEAYLTNEQKLKAERLKRAKMFVAMLKSGAAPSKAEPSRGLSADPQGSGASGFGADVSLAARERERSSAPSDFDISDKKMKSEKEHLNEERRAKRKYRSRSSRDEEGETAEAEDEIDDDDGHEREGKRSHKHHTKKHRSRKHSVEEESEDKYGNERDYKHGKRRHRSHRSSHKHDDKDKSNEEERDYKYTRKNKNRSPSSSYEDDEQESEPERELKYSRKKHQSHHSSHDKESCDEGESDHKYSRKKRSSREEDDGRDERHYRRKHRSHKSSHHSRDRHKHRKSHSSRHRQKSDVSLEEELRDHNRADKHGKGSHTEREELEEGEISSKFSGQSKGARLVDGASREPSVDVSSSYQDRRPPPQPSETTEVPDDLRAKIRAMLMSTL